MFKSTSDESPKRMRDNQISEYFTCLLMTKLFEQLYHFPVCSVDQIAGPVDQFSVETMKCGKSLFIGQIVLDIKNLSNHLQSMDFHIMLRQLKLLNKYHISRKVIRITLLSARFWFVK